MDILKFFGKLSDAEKAFFTGQYLTKASKITHPRKPATTELSRVNVALIPFGISPAASVTIADFRKVSITVQSGKIAKMYDTNLSKFGVRLDPGDAVEDASFLKPAICRITLSQPATSATSETSNRTGRTYKAKPTRSGSIPFGRMEAATGTIDKKTGVAETSTAEIDYEDARSTLEKLIRTTAISGLKASVGFKPEIWALGKAASGIGTTGITGAFTFS